MAGIYPYALLTVDELKVDLGVPPTEDQFDSIIQVAINAASRWVETRTCRPIVARTHTDAALNGTGTPDIWVKPIVIAVTEAANNELTVTLSDIDIDTGTGRLHLTDGSVWVKGCGTVVLTYRHGWERDDLPQELVLAARLLANKFYNDIVDHRVGVTAKTKAEESISYEKGIPQIVTMLVDPYRLVWHGQE